VTCVQHDSKVVFISHAALSEHVLPDQNSERDIKIESAIKELFHQSREDEHQKTVWKGKLTAKHAASTEGNFPEDEPKPKLSTVNDYLKEKFEKDYLHMIMGGLHEREIQQLSGDDQELA
jgi:hypothetical protein